VGLAIGFVAAFFLTKLMASNLEVSAHDPFSFVIVGPAAFHVGLIACYIPARWPCASIRLRRSGTNNHPLTTHIHAPGTQIRHSRLLKTPGFTGRRAHHRRARDRGEHRRFQPRERAARSSRSRSRTRRSSCCSSRNSADGPRPDPVSVPEYLDYEKQLTQLRTHRAFNFANFNLTGGDTPERVQGALVTPSVFPVLGVQPIKGRFFNDSEMGEGNDGVVVVSERLWRRRFNSDPQLVGNSFRSMAAASRSSALCRPASSSRYRSSACRVGRLPSAPISGSRSHFRRTT
jgi:hypothetical protein